MHFGFSNEQELLRETARRYLTDRLPTSHVRQLMITPSGHDPLIWKEMAEMGWHGLALPREVGGSGSSVRELAIVLEEMGRVLAPGPFFSTVALAAPLVEAAASGEQRHEALGAIADGRMTATVALVAPDGRWGEGRMGVDATQVGDGWILAGQKSFVVDGHTADLLIVPADTGDGPALFLVEGSRSGVRREAAEVMDLTRKLADVRFDGVRVEDARRIGEPGAAAASLQRMLDIASVCLAAEQVGGAERVLEIAVAYAKDRKQFGRPIGSFQAVKHMCADMLVSVEAAKSVAHHAAWAAGADDEDLPVAASLAAAYCSEVYYRVAADNIQIHGGIGFTWEHDAHLFFKRAASSRMLLGTPTDHRAELAARLGV